MQKIIAAAGVTSRRKAEAFIVAGRVAVNGEVVRELGTTADPESDLVTLDGHPLRREPLRYFVAHKPRGVLCAVHDDRGRPLVVDLLPDDVDERLYPAGRLDLDSEGLVLLTNDGDLMQRATRPGGGVAKMYEVVVGGRPSEGDLDALRAGAELDGRRLMRCDIEVLERIEPDDTGGPGAEQRGFTRLRVTLQQGNPLNVGGDEVRNDLPQEPRTGSELENPALSGRQGGGDVAVPLEVQLPQEPFFLEDLEPQRCRPRIVEVEPAREGMFKPGRLHDASPSRRSVHGKDT